MSSVTPIIWEGGVLRLLDQRLLPHEEVYVECRSPEETATAIREMVVRGAPAIGVCAAFGMVTALGETSQSPEASLSRAADLLRVARPTAVNLGWAIDRVLDVFRAMPVRSVAAVRERLEREAILIFEEDVAANRAIGRFGKDLLAQECRVLTHCNAGALATAGYGTALGVIRAAHESGKKISVLADETRPYLQGARLTAWELDREGIEVSIITDNMPGHFFRQGQIDAVIVGADRIAANGDAANKIGTYTLAVLAKAHDIPFYVAAPVSTIDFACFDGSSIPIEQRSRDEVLWTSGWDEQGTLRRISYSPVGVPALHPAFDVTPNELITAIITEQGVLRAPFDDAIAKLRE